MKRMIPRRWRRSFWLYLNTVLAKLETLEDGDNALPHPPIFIIGAPRSGSTLLYQTLVEALDVGYLSNLHCRFFGAPALVERWLFPHIARPATDFSSEYGRTRGHTAPSECGDFWYRFFPHQPQAVTSIPAPKARAMRAAIAHLIVAAQRPFLFKNLINSLRLLPLARVLPEASFIVIHRDPLANARSLLIARKRAYGDYRPWWSARPAQIEDIEHLPPHQQVVEQIIAIHEAINAARLIIGPQRFLDIQYEHFCEDVQSSLERISHFLFAQGASPLARRPGAVPAHFPISSGGVLEPDLEDALRAYVEAQRDRLFRK